MPVKVKGKGKFKPIHLELLETIQQLLDIARRLSMAIDDTKLEASITQLSTDVDSLIQKAAGGDPTAQAALDKAQAAVDAVDTKVKGAL